MADLPHAHRARLSGAGDGYGLNHGKFDDPDMLWSVAGMIILLSILIHGVTVTAAMRRLDQKDGRPARLETPQRWQGGKTQKPGRRFIRNRPGFLLMVSRQALIAATAAAA